MIKQLKLASTIGALVLATATSSAMGAASSADDTYPSSTLSSSFWTERMFKTMDKNKDGMVSRDEYMAYMGQQYDKMDQKKKKALGMNEFTDKSMMSSTFPSSARE